MKIIDCEQGTDEWLQARCGIATASCFAKILATVKSGEAADRRNYRARLVVERLTQRPIGTFETPAMRQGVEREPMARAAYEARTRAFVEQVGFMRHEELEAGASPDGLVEDKGLLEIKCPELAAHLANLQSPHPPAVYVPQIQGQLWIAEREWCDFASYNPDFPTNLQLVVRRVYRDEVAIKSLALAVELFLAEVRAEVKTIRELR